MTKNDIHTYEARKAELHVVPFFFLGTRPVRVECGRTEGVVFPLACAVGGEPTAGGEDGYRRGAGECAERLASQGIKLPFLCMHTLRFLLFV